jgi:predicted ABC-class ATPase
MQLSRASDFCRWDYTQQYKTTNKLAWVVWLWSEKSKKPLLGKTPSKLLDHRYQIVVTGGKGLHILQTVHGETWKVFITVI